ncbi:hypothetical protein BgiMline_031797, partial [Biomphalaria glabrata]
VSSDGVSYAPFVRQQPNHDRDSVWAMYTYNQPSFIHFFQNRMLSKQFCLSSIKNASPWVQKMTTDHFGLADTDKNGVIDNNDVNNVSHFMVIVDLLVMGADLNDDYAISKKEMDIFCGHRNFSKEYKFFCHFLFKGLDRDMNGVIDANDIAFCKY